MRSRMRAAVILSLACLAPLSADEILHWQKPGDNRLTNGGFEEAGGPGEVAAGWVGFVAQSDPAQAAIVEPSPNAHTGRSCIRLKAGGKNIVGANRVFGGGNPGTLTPLTTGWAEFWYQAISSEAEGNLYFYVISVQKTCTGENGRATYEVPKEHVGDGKWHRGTIYFDFSDDFHAKYTLFAPRINEARGIGSGEMLVDDVALYPRGPDLSIAPGGFERPLAKVGEVVRLRGSVRNLGTTAADTAKAAVLLRGPASVVGNAAIPIPPVPAGADGSFEWQVRVTGKGPITARVRILGDGYGEASWPAVAVGVGAQAPGKVVCETPTARMRYVPQGDWGFFRVEARPEASGSWRPAGLIPFLGWAVVGPERDAVVFPARPGASPARWVSTARDAHGRSWKMEATLAKAPGGAIRIESSFALGGTPARVKAPSPPHPLIPSPPHPLTPSSSGVPVYSLFAPWLLLGESAAKHEACFPGLEYLASEESSSNELDGRYPHSLRWAPHPNKVTIPFLSVSFPWGTAGIAWGPLQKWDGRRDRPQPLFAVPNRFGGQGNHLFALALPGGIEGRGENRLEAQAPCRVSISPLRVSADLFFAPGDTTDAAVAWYLRNRPLPPDPELPRTLEEGLRLCVESSEARWSGEAKGWYGTSWWHRGAFPSSDVARELWLASLRSQDTEKRDLWRSRARAAADALGGRVDFSFGLYLGDLWSSVETQWSATRHAIGTQTPEGGWPFGGNPTWDLGKPGKVVSGTTTSLALGLLRFAAATGDEDALKAGVKALDFCNTQDPIPRGGQTWEVPLHSPDPIVAGQALLAHVIVYEITGDREWLRKARHWAHAGIPFIYLWKAPERPIMPYATLPVFGCSGWTDAWYGRPVQWCGLVLVNPLQRFAEYDQSADWKAIARGITIAAMQQQLDFDRRVYPDKAGTPPDQLYWYYPKQGLERLVGMYPDNYLLHGGRNFCWDYMLSPNSHTPLTDSVLQQLGVEPLARSRVLRTPAGRVHVTAPLPIRDASLEGDALTVTLANPKGWPVRVLVACVSRPAKVEVDGRDIAPGDLADDGAPSWSCRSTRAVCVVQGSGEKIILRGVSPQTPENVDRSGVAAWEFDEPGETGGFAPQHDIDGFSVREGRLRVRVSGDDPYFAVTGLRVDAGRFRALRVRLSVKPAAGAAGPNLLEAFFCHPGEGISADRAVSAPLVCDGEMHEVAIPLAGNASWKGTIALLRLDPTHGLPRCEVEVDWIRFE